MQRRRSAMLDDALQDALAFLGGRVGSPGSTCQSPFPVLTAFLFEDLMAPCYCEEKQLFEE
jgi:hypothetical protein